MRLFGRKKKVLAPPPIPEAWDWDTMVGHQVQGILNEDPGILEAVVRTGAPRLSIYFDEVGTATLDLSYTDDGLVSIVSACWIATNPNIKRRGFGLIGYSPDGLARLVEPGSPVEQVGRGLTLLLGDGDVLMLPAAAPLPSRSEIDRIRSSPNAHRTAIGVGTRPSRHLYRLTWSSPDSQD